MFQKLRDNTNGKAPSITEAVEQDTTKEKLSSLA